MMKAQAEGLRREPDAQLRAAIYWLLRSYDAGHRKGWEPGPNNAETMTGLHAFLCNLGYDPNVPETRAWLAEWEATG